VVKSWGRVDVSRLYPGGQLLFFEADRFPVEPVMGDTPFARPQVKHLVLDAENLCDLSDGEELLHRCFPLSGRLARPEVLDPDAAGSGDGFPDSMRSFFPGDDPAYRRRGDARPRCDLDLAYALLEQQDLDMNAVLLGHGYLRCGKFVTLGNVMPCDCVFCEWKNM
jgi:hypothetical protein